MSAIFQPLWRIRRLLGWDLPQSKAAAPATPKIPQPSQGTMKKPTKEPGTISPILTHGLERDPGIYGALAFSKQEVQRSVQEGRNEAEAHAKEIAPIKSYEYAGSPANGIGLLDQEFLRRTAQWQMEQKALMADRNSINEILPNAHGIAPTKTFHN